MSIQADVYKCVSRSILSGARRIKHKVTYSPIENPANKHLIGKSRRTAVTNVIMACQNGAGNLSYIRRILNLYV